MANNQPKRLEKCFDIFDTGLTTCDDMFDFLGQSVSAALFLFLFIVASPILLVVWAIGLLRISYQRSTGTWQGWRSDEAEY